jgi:flagellar biosynthesis/type III secretory pathway chaperone
LKNDTDRLNGIVQEETMILSAVKALEKKRVQILGSLAKRFQIPENQITVTEIIDRTVGETRERFIALQKELSALLNTQRDMNDQNQALLNTHLEYTNMMLNLLIGPEDPLNNFYGGDGKTSAQTPRKKAGLIDRQA